MSSPTTRAPRPTLKAPTIRPYIRVQADQLDDLLRLLDRHEVPYFLDPISISVEGGPEMKYVHLDRFRDAPRVQAILDESYGS